MKNTFLIIAIAFTVLTACKKSDPIVPSPNNLICDGIGNSDLFPLNVGNYWTYIVKKTGVPNPELTKIEVYNDSFYYGQNYFFLTDSSEQMFGASRFYRKDTGGHTMFMITGYSEAIEILKSPALNQSWNSLFYSRKVVNQNASIKTSSCNYTGLIQVNEMDGGFIRSRRYYKKGLGLVYSVSPKGGDSVEFILTDVRIK